MEKIDILRKKLSSIISDNEDNFNLRVNIKTKNKFDLKSMLYANAIALNADSIDIVISDLKTENITYASKNALIKRRNEKRTSTQMSKINDSLLDSFYNDMVYANNKYSLNKNKSFYMNSKVPDKKLFINNTRKRFIACDGTQFNVSKNAINNTEIKPSNSSDYGVLMVSEYYDVMNNIPSDYQIIKSNKDDELKKANERKGLINNLHLFNENDILIFDRLYFNKTIHTRLIEKEIGYIFRVKNNSLLFRDISYGKSKKKVVNGVVVQLFKYRIKNEDYCILTSIIDRVTIGEIKALYWRRWKIETDINKVKYKVLSDNIRSKNYNSICTDIEAIRFMSIRSSIIEYIGQRECPENKKINSNNCIYLLYKSLLKTFLFKSNDKEEILRLVGIVFATIVVVFYGREYARKRVRPSTKWNRYGNRYGAGN